MRLIDADELMDELENEQPLNWTDSPGEIQEQADWERFKGMVSVANTIEAEPVRHGRWIWKGDDKGWFCSECGGGCLLDTESDWFKSDGCPHCRAKMDGDDDATN